MPTGHKAQLLICHEKIYAAPGPMRASTAVEWAYCDLKAVAWCYDCDYYTCDIHLVSRHITHDTTNRD